METEKPRATAELLNEKASWLKGWIREREKWLFVRTDALIMAYYFILIFATVLAWKGWHGNWPNAVMSTALLAVAALLPKLYDAVLRRFLKKDTLYCRGLLIMNAVKRHNVHKAKFELWQKAVQFGNLDPDPEYAQSNEKYLGQVQQILILAIFDLYKNSELDRMQKECEAESDKIRDKASLSELVVRVGSPIEAPQVRVAVPRVRIEYEDALLEISQDLDGEKDLSEKIKALAKTTR